MRDFIIALQFLTRISIWPQSVIDANDYPKVMRMYPLVGLIIGGLLTLIYWLIFFSFTSNIIASAVVIISAIYITGGLHLDGLMDTADGFYSYSSSDKIIEIMKDSRVGANAVLALFSLMLLKFSLLVTIPMDLLVFLLVIMTTLSRWIALYCAAKYKHATLVDGLGSSVIGKVKKSSLFFGSNCCLFIIFMLSYLRMLNNGNGYYLISYLLFGFFLWLTVFCIGKFIVKVSYNKINGITGDVLGAIIEVSEIAVLLIGFAIYKGVINLI